MAVAYIKERKQKGLKEQVGQMDMKNGHPETGRKRWNCEVEAGDHLTHKKGLRMTNE